MKIFRPKKAQKDSRKKVGAETALGVKIKSIRARGLNYAPLERADKTGLETCSLGPGGLLGGYRVGPEESTLNLKIFPDDPTSLKKNFFENIKNL